MSVEEATTRLWMHIHAWNVDGNQDKPLDDAIDRLILEVRAAGQCGRDCVADPTDKDACLRCWAEAKLMKGA